MATNARNVTIVRVLKLAKRLDGARYSPSLALLAEDFGVCERTIRRDLEALEEAGWKVPMWRYFSETTA